MEEQIKTDEVGQNGAKPVTAKKKRKEKRLTFGKVFLASLLAVVAGSVITMVFWLGLFSGIASMMESDGVAVPERAVLRIDLAEHLVDAPSKDPLSGFNLATMSSGGSLTLYDALRAIEAARDDDRIEGIYIRLDGGGTTTPNILEELRAAIVDFKQSGKFVVAYNEVYSQWTYYLCSAADKIYIQPEGGFDWSGITLTTMFYKGLIDKLGIEVDILRPTACKFKSAVEPMFLTQMSEANRMQMQAIADNMWSVITEAVSEARGISVDELNRIADDLAVTLPQEAVEHKFVDAALYADEVEDVFENDYDLEDPEFISLKDYASGLTTDVSKVAAPKVAVVYANGTVLDGNGTDDNIYGYTFSKTLKKVAEDDDVKAVVVRVNSPGGSALASDIIWREMELLREKKPVIISMGQYAASGGYYISAPADAIVADRLTLTGSIGVYGMLPAVGKALKDKIGITFDGVVTNKYSDMGNGVMGLSLDPLNEKEYNTVMRGVDRVYDRGRGSQSADRESARNSRGPRVDRLRGAEDRFGRHLRRSHGRVGNSCGQGRSGRRIPDSGDKRGGKGLHGDIAVAQRVGTREDHRPLGAGTTLCRVQAHGGYARSKRRLHILPLYFPFRITGQDGRNKRLNDPLRKYTFGGQS